MLAGCRRDGAVAAELDADDVRRFYARDESRRQNRRVTPDLLEGWWKAEAKWEAEAKEEVGWGKTKILSARTKAN